MEEHFVCTGGCKGVSLKPGTCQEKSCPNYGHPLEYCDCGKPEHNFNKSEAPLDNKKK